jgi:hypothetical protein
MTKRSGTGSLQLQHSNNLPRLRTRGWHSKPLFESPFDGFSGAWSAPFEVFSVSSMELDANLKCRLLQSIRRHALNQPVITKALYIADYLA